MQINGMDLQDLTPEELAQLLAKDNPMLVSSWASSLAPNTFKREFLFQTLFYFSLSLGEG